METRLRTLQRRGVATAAGLCLALSAAAPSAAADRERVRSDVAVEVRYDLARRGIDHVEVLLRGDEIVLRGEVASLDQRRRAMRIARRAGEGLDVLDQTWLASLDAAGEQDLAAAVARSLRNVPYYSVFDWVEVDLDGSTVRLSGVIDQPWKRDVLVRRLEEIPGLARIDDQVRTLRLSSWDDRVRRQVARAIYGNLTFYGRGVGLAQPIHIVVEKGQVRLEGVVGNDAERMLARSLAARSPNSVGPIVNNLKTLAEVRR